jgi:hypothetical protein
LRLAQHPWCMQSRCCASSSPLYLQRQHFSSTMVGAPSTMVSRLIQRSLPLLPPQIRHSLVNFYCNDR